MENEIEINDQALDKISDKELDDLAYLLVVMLREEFKIETDRAGVSFR